MITDDRAEGAAMYIRDKAKEYARAKSERVQLEEFRKTKKAIAMKDAERAGHTTSAAQEREAYASKEYIDLLDGIKDATEREERIRWEMVSAQLTVEIWRTQQSTARLEMRATQ